MVHALDREAQTGVLVFFKSESPCWSKIKLKQEAKKKRILEEKTPHY